MKTKTIFRICAIALLMQLLSTSFSYGQDITVHGNVKDIFNRILFGTSVKLNGTTNEVFTDSMGYYEITVPIKGQLIFSHEGFVTQKKAVKGKTTIDVCFTLDLDRSANRKINTGFGFVKKSQTAQTSESVDQKMLDQNNEADITQLLQTVPGIKIIKEGSEINILIRGIRSLSGNNYALIVLNGSPFYGSLNDLDRNAIKSIEVLKDAASLTGYGSRGANGVVLITTKEEK
jgi:TonB-dependent starch-binding outer membrane protein SusC